MLILSTLFLQALTMGLGIVVAWQHAAQPAQSFLEPIEFTAGNAVIFVVMFALFTFVMIRFVRAARVSLRFILMLAALVGVQYAVSPWLPWEGSVLVAVGALLLVGIVRLVIVHDLVTVVSIAGIATLLGLSLDPIVASALLAILALYDIVSVYRTGHMVVLAERMMRSGSVFGFLVPARFSGFFLPVRRALQRQDVMMLGSGDIGLPLVLAASAVRTSLGAAILVALFALGGLFAMQWMFTHQRSPRPMAALPPIAASAIIGYVIAVLLGV